jgi:hypothetical protein
LISSIKLFLSAFATRSVDEEGGGGRHPVLPTGYRGEIRTLRYRYPDNLTTPCLQGSIQKEVIYDFKDEKNKLFSKEIWESV